MSQAKGTGLEGEGSITQGDELSTLNPCYIFLSNDCRAWEVSADQGCVLGKDMVRVKEGREREHRP